MEWGPSGSLQNLSRLLAHRTLKKMQELKDHRQDVQKASLGTSRKGKHTSQTECWASRHPRGARWQEEEKKTEWQSDAKAQKPRGHSFSGSEGTLHLTPAGPGAP